MNRLLPPLALGLALTVAPVSAGAQPAPQESPSSPPFQASVAPSGGSAPPRVALRVRRGASRSAERWLQVVRDDLALVDDVRLVRSRPELELSAAAANEGERRVLRVSLTRTLDGSTAYEQAFDLGLPGARPVLLEQAARRAGHVTSDGLLEALVGRRGGFDSTLVFARRVARRRKDIFRTGSDGLGLSRVSSGRSIAMLPSLADGDVWYSIMNERGLFLTRAGAQEQPLLGGDDELTMGVQPCGDGIVFSSTRDGDSEIYYAGAGLSDVTRLTHDPGIDVSPSCGPNGRVAFVSNRGGGPRIHLLDPGVTPAQQIDQPDSENQTPVVCSDPERPLLAFTRVIGRAMSVWTMPLGGGAATRVSPARGRYKDPAFSPDCRLIAYVGDEGIWISSLDGRRRRLVVRGPAETVRWGRSLEPRTEPEP